VFPFRVWQPFRDAVRGLDQPPAGPHGRRLTILGGPFPYRLGRLRFGAYDRTGDWLPAVTSNAWFLDDATGAPGQAVPGLRTRLFEARQLRCEDAPGDPFGQRWVLEDS
jgi:guanyl-specific ribonuclease Sa